LQEGVHLRIVQERLGHATAVITQNTYQHVAETLQREAADQIADAILGEPLLSPAM
jgi:integrase